MAAGASPNIERTKRSSRRGVPRMRCSTSKKARSKSPLPRSRARKPSSLAGRIITFVHKFAGNEGNIAPREPNVFEDGIRQFVQCTRHPMDKLAAARSCDGRVKNKIDHCGLHAWCIAGCGQLFPGWIRRSYSSASACSAATPFPEKDGPCISASVRGDTFASARIVVPMPGLRAE